MILLLGRETSTFLSQPRMRSYLFEFAEISISKRNAYVEILFTLYINSFINPNSSLPFRSLRSFFIFTSVCLSRVYWKPPFPFARSRGWHSNVSIIWTLVTTCPICFPVVFQANPFQSKSCWIKRVFTLMFSINCKCSS